MTLHDSLAMDGVLTVGVDAAPPVPMQIGRAGSAEFFGFEVDLLQEMAGRLQLSLRYMPALWAEIADALGKKNIDVICAAATITSQREQEFAFSRPYLPLALALVTTAKLALHPGVSLEEQLQGKRFGVRIETTAEAFIRRHLRPSSLQTYHFNDEVYRALELGQVDAVIDDLPIARYFSKTTAGLCEPMLIPGTETSYGIMFRKDNVELRQVIDRVLESMETDGTHARLTAKWFG